GFVKSGCVYIRNSQTKINERRMNDRKKQAVRRIRNQRLFLLPESSHFYSAGNSRQKNRKGTDTAGDLKHTTKYKH
ncbi:hypothetical protein, partial [Morganella morganii]|uniref:hypothetical protein n=1 Tax=Morganella morganii TaxID=582 RepID=UPI001C70EE1D